MYSDIHISCSIKSLPGAALSVCRSTFLTCIMLLENGSFCVDKNIRKLTIHYKAVEFPNKRPNWGHGFCPLQRNVRFSENAQLSHTYTMVNPFRSTRFVRYRGVVCFSECPFMETPAVSQKVTATKLENKKVHSTP